MRIHASCAARGGAGLLVTGPAGSGKSDLVLRLLDLGFVLVADDQVVITEGVARAPPALLGLLEVRGLGILRVAHLDSARLCLVVRLVAGGAGARLPEPRRDETLGLPVIEMDPFQASAAQRVAMAFGCATGAVAQVAGAFAA
jgi:HPr kinase/phosphorylase